MVDPPQSAEVLAQPVDDIPLRIGLDEEPGARDCCQQRSRRVLRRPDHADTDDAGSGGRPPAVDEPPAPAARSPAAASA